MNNSKSLKEIKKVFKNTKLFMITYNSFDDDIKTIRSLVTDQFFSSKEEAEKWYKGVGCNYPNVKIIELSGLDNLHADYFWDLD